MSDSTYYIKHLNRLRDYYAKWKSFPSYKRLCAVLDLSSAAGVGNVLKRLLQEGYLERTPDKIWIPGLRFFDRQLIPFNIPAGTPVDVADTEFNAFQIDDYVVSKPSMTEFLRVKGDSMVDAGIFEGDLAAIERRSLAKPGEIVAAFVDNELTLKELALDGDAYVLRPRNKAYQLIRPRDKLEIYGVLIGIVRKY